MSDRPYDEEQVFYVEVHATDVARHLAEHGPYDLRRLGMDLLEAIVYDACIALREVMIEEEDSRG